MRYLSIKGFDGLQHYKDWQPPWIKLYNRLLDDYAFLQLSEVAQRHLICMWLLASRHDNRIPNDLVYITRAIQAKSAVDLDEMIVAGFVVPTDAPARHKRRKRNKLGHYKKSRPGLESVKTKSTPETETETETDKRQKKEPRPAVAGSWPAEGTEWYAEKVAPIPIPRFAKAMKPTVDRFGWPDTFSGLRVWEESTRGKARRLEWFAADSVRWIELGRMPCVDQETGDLTARGKLALSS